jgi:hypothetical protein
VSIVGTPSSLIASERVPARQAAVFPKDADVVSEFRSGRGRRRRPLPSKRRAPSHNPVSDDYLGPTPPVFPETGGSDAACCVSALAEERRPNDPVGKTPPFASPSPLHRAGTASSPTVKGVPVDRRADAFLQAVQRSYERWLRCVRESARSKALAARISTDRRRVSAHLPSSPAVSAIRAARHSTKASWSALHSVGPSVAPACTSGAFPGNRRVGAPRLTANSGEQASRPFRPAAPPTGTSRAIDYPKALETVYGTLPPRTFSHRVAVM